MTSNVLSEKINNICIMVDSGSDMIPEEAQKMGVTLLPLKVRFGEEEFEDGVTISRDEFYHRLEEADTIPKTSQISPATYEEAFNKETAAGREVICLVISSGISGCYQSAMIAKDNCDGVIHVIDTCQFCGPEFLLVQRAVMLRNQGMSAQRIVDTIEKEKKEVRVIALFDTLKYLQMGGRISKTAACIGGVLSIKPVVTIENGGVKVLGKARGSKNGNNYLIQSVQESGGIDWTRPILISWSGRTDTTLKQYINDSSILYEGHDKGSLPVGRVGATIGTYAGPNAIAFSYFPRNEK